MATDYFLVCDQCESRLYPGFGLFDLLHAKALKSGFCCPVCGADRKASLSFPFNAGRLEGELTASYIPTTPIIWDEGDTKVQFFPFLVIVSSDENGSQNIWLPYWHVEMPGRLLKYGQWAPNMDLGAFAELVAQAQQDGYL